MPIYIRRSEAVEAEQFDPSARTLWPRAITPHPAQIPEGAQSPNAGSWGWVDTVAGRKAIYAKDWIVKNKKGHQWVYKPSEFEALYMASPGAATVHPDDRRRTDDEGGRRAVEAGDFDAEYSPATGEKR